MSGARKEEFDSAASQYLGLRLAVIEAQQKAAVAASEVDRLTALAMKADRSLGEFVGANITSRCAVLSGGHVVTVEYGGEAKGHHIRAFGPEGEKIL